MVIEVVVMFCVGFFSMALHYPDYAYTVRFFLFVDKIAYTCGFLLAIFFEPLLWYSPAYLTDLVNNKWLLMTIAALSIVVGAYQLIRGVSGSNNSGVNADGKLSRDASYFLQGLFFAPFVWAIDLVLLLCIFTLNISSTADLLTIPWFVAGAGLGAGYMVMSSMLILISVRTNILNDIYLKALLKIRALVLLGAGFYLLFVSLAKHLW